MCTSACFQVVGSVVNSRGASLDRLHALHPWLEVFYGSVVYRFMGFMGFRGFIIGFIRGFIKGFKGFLRVQGFLSPMAKSDLATRST